MAARSAIVTGHVQGVGFRAFVQHRARNLGIRGEVWNRSDGSVELEFEHEDAGVLDELERLLWNGPGHVQGVFVQSLSKALEAQGFTVSFSR